MKTQTSWLGVGGISLMPGQLDSGFHYGNEGPASRNELLSYPTHIARAEYGPAKMKETFYRWLEGKGLTVSEEPQFMVRMFAPDRDPVGYSQGSMILVAKDYNGRELTDAEKMAIAAHEYGHAKSGDNNEGAAQGAGKRALRMFGFEPSIRIMDGFDENLRNAGYMN